MSKLLCNLQLYLTVMQLNLPSTLLVIVVLDLLCVRIFIIFQQNVINIEGNVVDKMQINQFFLQKMLQIRKTNNLHAWGFFLLSNIVTFVLLNDSLFF